MSTTIKKDQTSQVKEAASQAVEKGSEAAGHVGEAVQAAASAVGQTAEKATAAVGRTVGGFSETVRQSGPQEGVLGSATRGVADTLEEAGKYIEEKNLTGMMDDVTGMINRNPIPAVLIGLGIGFLVGRALSARS
ncbi:MAG: hypothetical protein U0840_26370 [Gemmataceae bacterium]